jgi:hypothetical protein
LVCKPDKSSPGKELQEALEEMLSAANTAHLVRITLMSYDKDEPVTGSSFCIVDVQLATLAEQ